jgi:hypothetical protein
VNRSTSAYQETLTIERARIRKQLAITNEHVQAVNALLIDLDEPSINEILDIVLKYGSPEEINRQAAYARQLPVLLRIVDQTNPSYLKDLEWLQQQRDSGRFVTVSDYRRKILGKSVERLQFHENTAVTLEISACQYFPWLIQIAQDAIENQKIMPGRVIRVRKMHEQELDGDLPAMMAAMQIIGASIVEQPDTRGVDGSNIHLGGPDTLIGYFGGVGQPNHYPLKWLDECLYYYTKYGVQQVLNLNHGTVLVGYLLFRLGVDLQFKISVTLGNDNPYAALWTLLTARLFTRPDGSTPLVGFNWSNSVTNETIEKTASLRKKLGLEDQVRFEHHVTETWKGLVIQPYLRRQELLALATTVPNISAKHEGGEPDIEMSRSHPSDIMDYYRDKSEIIASGDWDNLQQNFLDKFDSLNLTAQALTEKGLAFIAARKLHQ